MRRRWIDFDPWTPIIVLVLLCIGLTAIYSATYSSRGLSYVKRQLLAVALGLIILAAVMLSNYEWWLTHAHHLYFLAMVLLGLTLVLGRAVSGSRSWLIFGPFHFQTAEAAKLAAALMWARVIGGRPPQRLRTFRFSDFVLTTFIAAVPMSLIMLQPDVGTAMTFLFPLGVLWILLRMPFRYWLTLAMIFVIALPVGWINLKPYQKERIRVFLGAEKTDPHGPGYQVWQSKIALGSGGLLGKGFQKGSQTQLGFVPERHTDFVLTTLGEEWGFLGVSAVLFLYLFLFLRWYDMALQTYDPSGQVLMVTLAAFWFCHVVVNAGMVIGWTPVTGLPLPLVSYGGSFVIFCLASVGFILNVYWIRRLIQMKLT